MIDIIFIVILLLLLLLLISLTAASTLTSALISTLASTLITTASRIELLAMVRFGRIIVFTAWIESTVSPDVSTMNRTNVG